MHPNRLAPLALGLLALPAAALADVQLTSFESGLSPWFSGGDLTPGTTTYSINASSASDGASSAQAVIPMSGGTFGVVYGFNVADYASILQSGATGLSADVYFEWDQKPSSADGGAYYGLTLNLNHEGHWSTLDASSGALTENNWSTIRFDLDSGQIDTITNPALSYSTLGFLLNTGVYGDAVIGGTITVRFDNVVAVDAGAIPEPASAATLLGALALGATALRRRRR